MQNKRKLILTLTLSAVLGMGALALPACKTENNEPKDESYEEIYKQPTCTETGELRRYPSKDSTTYETVTIPALGHLYDENGWEIIEQPTYASEGTKKGVCERCGATEYQIIDMLPSAYQIKVYDGAKMIECVYVEDDGLYEITAPTKLGYTFAGFHDEQGNSFASSGKVDKDVTVYTSWNIQPTLTFAELKERAAAGVDKILLGADITVTETVYFVGQTELYVTEDHTITRAEDFGGDMFVVGENTIVSGNRAELTVKPADGAHLTVDGNKQNVTAEVSGTALLLVESSVVNMYEGVTVANCKKTANAKLTDDSYKLSYPEKIGGAAMVVVNGTFNMYGGSFDNNEVNLDETNLGDDESEELRTSSCGGAIYNYSAVNIYGGTFNGNSAARGGAIYNYRTLRVYAATFEDNYASVYAGAVYLPGSQYSVLYLGDVDGNTENTISFENNSSEKSGGAIFGQMKNTIVVYGGTTFTGNTARGNNGGAINTSGALIVNDATFTENLAASKGGAIYVYYSDAELTTRQVEINGGSFVNNSASKGGAIAFSASQTDFDNGSIGSVSGTLFSGNTAYATSTSDPELPDDGESGGETTEKNFNGNGGAIYISRKSTVSITGNCKFENNGAERKGGAVYVTNSQLDIDSASFKSNSSVGNGGAVYCYTGSTVEISNAAFESNSSDGTEQGGGALYFTGANATVTDCSFTGNKATANNGGAVGAYSASNVTFCGNSTFIGNTAAGNGGAIYIASEGTQVTIEGDSTFTGNTATTYGGAIYITGPSTLTVNDVTATGNSAKSGGFIYFTKTGTVVTILAGEASNNVASTSGATACGNASKAYIKVTADFIYPDGTITGKYTLEVISNEN